MPCARRKRRLAIGLLCGVLLCGLAAHSSFRRVFQVISSAKYSSAPSSSSSSSFSTPSSFSPSSQAQGQLRDIKDNNRKNPANPKGDHPEAKAPGVVKNTGNNPYSFPAQPTASRTTAVKSAHAQSPLTDPRHHPSSSRRPQSPKPSTSHGGNASASSSRPADSAVWRRVKLRDVLYPTNVATLPEPFPTNVATLPEPFPTNVATLPEPFPTNVATLPEPFPTNPVQLFSGYNVTGESPALLNDLYQRFLRVERSCAASKKRGKVAGIFTDDASRVAYCYLPKAGCTFWIRVFSYLHNFTGDSAKSPWEIPRLKLHNNPHSHGVLWGFLRDSIQHHLRFMFVRHPFSRLWSAYVDKFFLPDFWKEIGTRAVRKLRGARATQRAMTCGNDITFPEFVAFSLTFYEPHWAPIHTRCDPCLFKPTVVGSMKTFSRDNLFLLRRMGLEWVLKDVDHDSQNEKELTTLITYNFERIHSKPFYRPCVNDSAMTRLLWKAFQVNGYIPDDAPLPTPSSGVVSVKEFQGQVLGVFRAAWPRRRELTLQKERYLRQALASLPPALMVQVKQKYMPDMVYFGFNETNY